MLALLFSFFSSIVAPGHVLLRVDVVQAARDHARRVGQQEQRHRRDVLRAQDASDGRIRVGLPVEAAQSTPQE